MKKFWLLALIVALASLYMPAFADDDSMDDINSAIGALTSKVNALSQQASNFGLQIHGFAETDMINDTTSSFTETVGDGAVAKSGSFNGDNGRTIYSLRNSRIDFLATAPQIDGWDTKGYLEFDLLGYDPGPLYGATAAGPNDAADANEYHVWTQPTMRLRHAYLDAQKDGWDIMIGQYWTLFGWNMQYMLASVEDSPDMGTLYERTPELRITKTLGDKDGAQLQIAADTEQSQEEGGQVPKIGEGIRFVLNDWTGRFTQATGAPSLVPFSIALSEMNANYSYGNANYYSGNVWGSALAADILIPVVPLKKDTDNFSAVLTGEWTTGSGDSDEFNGGGFGGLSSMAIGTGPTNQTANLDADEAGWNSNGNFTLVQLTSWTTQLQMHLPASIGTIVTLGYGEVFSPNMGALTLDQTGALYNDDANMFANVIQDFTPNIRAGLEYTQYYTHYSGTALTPTDDRVQLSTWYRF